MTYTSITLFFSPLYPVAVSVMSVIYSCIAVERCECVLSCVNVFTFVCKIILYFYCSTFIKLYHLRVLNVLKSRSLDLLEPSGPDQSCNCIVFFPFINPLAQELLFFFLILAHRLYKM